MFFLLLKVCHQLSFEIVAVLFALPSKSVASEVFYRQLVHQFRTNSNIPSVIINGVINMRELDKLLHNSYERTPQFFKSLLEDFEDPSGRDRLPVGINIDATYFDLQGSEDVELQKHMFYTPRSGHTVKLLNMTDLASKIVGLLPVASSQSPSSGDGLLISKHIELQDSSESGSYVRAILRGNERYFVILITDAGFVVRVPNAPVQARGPTLADVCLQEYAVLLHTSSAHEKFHLERTHEGSIRKILWTEGHDTLDENVVKFVRLLRKMQEQVHAGLKGMFKLFDMRHLWNTVLLPLTSSQLRRFNLPQESFRNMPRLNYISTVCCSLFNTVHPGFAPLYMDPSAQSQSARSLLTRQFLENPLLYPDNWPISFTGAQRGTAWVEVSFRDLETHDVIGFPKLNSDSINPIALDIVSGPHALQKADSLLTYMHQLLIKEENLTREQAVQRLQLFPSDWRVQYTDLRTPDDFEPSEDIPRYCPSWWNEAQFGQWQDLRLVRCHIPPSYKTATTRVNFHWAVIAFGREPSTRLGLRSPYDRILFWYCHKCPSKNGSMSMDRHLATLLKALSFPTEFKSTAKSVNILNTVAGTRRQTTNILPQVLSANLPPRIQRRSRNVRSMLSGRPNPIYNLNFPNTTINDDTPATDSHNNNTAQPTTTPRSSRTASPQSGPTPPQRSPLPCTPQNTGTSPTSTADPHSGAHSPEPDTTTPESDTATPEPDTAASDPVTPSFPPSTTAPTPDISSPQPSTSNLESCTGSPQPARTQARARSTSRQSGRSRESSLGPGALLSRHVAQLDPFGVYVIPGDSQSQPSSGMFDISHLQSHGLLNDGNVCGLISILLCFNRIQILRHLIDPHFCFTAVHTPDYASLILFRILSAMPSTASFLIQLE